MYLTIVACPIQDSTAKQFLSKDINNDEDKCAHKISIGFENSIIENPFELKGSLMNNSTFISGIISFNQSFSAIFRLRKSDNVEQFIVETLIKRVTIIDKRKFQQM